MKEVKKVFEEYKFLKVLLVIIGLVVVYSASYNYIHGKNYKYKVVDGLKFEGNMHYEHSLKKKNIEIKYPSDYKDTGNKYYLLSKDGEGANPSKRCILTIDNVSYKNVEHLAEGMAKYYKVEYDEKELNGRKYYHLEENRIYYNEYYLTEYKNKLLLINAESGSDECRDELSKIVNSIKLK